MDKPAKALFECEDYRDFLYIQFGGRGARSGLKTKLAVELEIKTSYLSRILGGHSELTPEQAYKTCEFFALNKIEQEYFISLVQLARAGTFDLKNFYKSQLEKIKKESQKVEKRINVPRVLSEKDQLKYYSRWIYLAVHVAVSIPEFKSLKEIALKFGLSTVEAQEVLDFLTQSNIIFYDDLTRKYSVGSTYTHLGQDSDLLFQHHYNWRLKSLQKISEKDKNALHYSGVFSLSKEDALKLKNNFLELLKGHIEIMKPSKEEVLYCQIIDFFEV